MQLEFPKIILLLFICTVILIILTKFGLIQEIHNFNLHQDGFIARHFLELCCNREAEEVIRVSHMRDGCQRMRMD